MVQSKEQRMKEPTKRIGKKKKIVNFAQGAQKKI